MPEVSVVIPTYNQPRYLRQAIDSALAQTYRDFEVIVVDDGSTDDTPDVVASYGERIRGLRKPNGGTASALNAGIRVAQGRWIGYLGHDDMWEPAKLERQMAAIRAHPQAALIYTDVVTVNAEGQPLSVTEYPCPPDRPGQLSQLLRTCYINANTVLVRRDVLSELGLFDETDPMTSDYDLWLRIAQRYDLLHVPEPLILYRAHLAQLSQNGLELEWWSKRAAMRALHRVGLRLGVEGVVLRFVDEILGLAWMARPQGGAYGWRPRLRALFQTAEFLVNPGGPEPRIPHG